MTTDEYYNTSVYPISDNNTEFPGIYTGWSYVPMQKIATVYEPEDAYMQGTIFLPDLNKPFIDGRGYVK